MRELTVIVPLYNQEKYIGQCLESILSQNKPNLSVIVVNDGSTDNSLEICKKIAAIDSRLNIISQGNQGLSKARWTGLLETRTKYVTFVDADDFILNGAYEDACRYMESNIDVVFYEITRYYEKTRRHERHIIDEGVYTREDIVEKVFPKMMWDFERKAPGLDCSLCIRIVKTELLREMYREIENHSFYFGEDMVITYPLLTRIQSMAVIAKSYYMHRQRKIGDIPQYIKDERFFDETVTLFSYLKKALKKNCAYDFGKQIDYLYMYSVNLKKMCYFDDYYRGDFLFPFDKVGKGSKIVLYGAGDVGKVYYEQLKRLEYCSEIVWVDKQAENMDDIHIKSVEVLNSEACKNFDNVVIAIENPKVVAEVSEYLTSMGFNSIVY